MKKLSDYQITANTKLALDRDRARIAQQEETVRQLNDLAAMHAANKRFVRAVVDVAKFIDVCRCACSGACRCKCTCSACRA